MHATVPSRCRSRYLLLVNLLLWCTACSPVGPNYAQPQPRLPDNWQNAQATATGTETAAIHHWWAFFQDPTLDGLINRALAANTDLKIAATRLREARALQAVATGRGLPALNAVAGYDENRRSAEVTDDYHTKALYALGFDANWELDLYGGIRRQVEAATATAEASREDLRDVQVSLAAEVARTYLTLRAGQQQLTIAQNNSQLQERTVELVRGKLELGLVSPLDLAQAETLAAQTRAQQPGLESQVAQARQQLALLLNQPADTLPPELARMGSAPPVPPQLPLLLPSALLRQRPDIRSAERQLAAATANVGVATAELFPRFSLNALIGLQSSSMGPLLGESSRYWSGGGTVNWLLFDGGRTRATIEVSQARRERAQLFYEKTVLTALTEVHSALVRLDRERATRVALMAAESAGKRAADLARGQYQAGLVPFLEVLQSEKTLLQAQDQRAQSEERLAVNMITLYKALGGGWQATTPDSSPSRDQPPSASTIP